MITALEIGAGLVLTATLLTLFAVVAAFQLGRLVTRDDEQRQMEPADAPRIRKVRPAGTFGGAWRRCTTMVARLLPHGHQMRGVHACVTFSPSRMSSPEPSWLHPCHGAM